MSTIFGLLFLLLHCSGVDAIRQQRADELEEVVDMAKYHKDETEVPSAAMLEQALKGNASALPPVLTPVDADTTVASPSESRKVQELLIEPEQATAQEVAAAIDAAKYGALRHMVELTMGPGAGSSDTLVHCFLILCALAVAVSTFFGKFAWDMKEVLREGREEKLRMQSDIVDTDQDTKDIIATKLKATKAVSDTIRSSQQVRYARASGPKKRRADEEAAENPSAQPEEQAAAENIDAGVQEKEELAIVSEECQKVARNLHAAADMGARAEHAVECFEHDWSHVIKTDALSSDQADACAEVVRQNYSWIMSLYTALASQDSAVGLFKDSVDVVGVSIRSAAQLLDSATHDGIDILDKDNLTKAKAEFLYKAAVWMAPEDKERLCIHHERSLVRHQFTNWLLRVAMAKFPEMSASHATRTLLEVLSDPSLTCNGRDFQALACSAEVMSTASAEQQHNLQAFFLKKTDSEHTSVRMPLKDLISLVSDKNQCIGFAELTRGDALYVFIASRRVVDELFGTLDQSLSCTDFQIAVSMALFLSEFRLNGSCNSERLGELISDLAK